jgi:hypothetical protein
MHREFLHGDVFLLELLGRFSLPAHGCESVPLAAFGPDVLHSFTSLKSFGDAFLQTGSYVDDVSDQDQAARGKTRV